MNLIKKVALLAAIPLTMASCSINLRLMGNKNLRESELILRVKNRRDLSNLSNYELMDYWDIKFRNSIYSSNLGYDSDGDGIINADEPFGWKYRYGPFIDSNGNGIVDIFDWQIDGFDSSYISNYPYRINERWIGLNLNPFWFSEYEYRYKNYFKINKRYRHQEKKYWNIHTIRNNKKRSNYNTRTRNKNYKKRNNSTNYKSIRTKSSRLTPTKKRSNYNTRTRNKNYKKRNNSINYKSIRIKSVRKKLSVNRINKIKKTKIIINRTRKRKINN